MSRDVACRVSMFTTTYKTFNINSLSNQIVETQNFASLLPHWNDNFDTPSTGAESHFDIPPTPQGKIFRSFRINWGILRPNDRLVDYCF